MHISVIADPALKEELLAQSPEPDADITWNTTPVRVPGVSCYIDLLFENNPARINALEALGPAVIIVNEVAAAAGELPGSFVRINGWPTFLGRPVIEAASSGDETRSVTSRVFEIFKKRVEWVPDHPGFVTARIVSMIINEAYHALGEKVSTKEEIDTAMKLGTNYPFGPFEWADKTGLSRVYSLLEKLATDHPGYEPAPLLKQEALSQ